MNEDIGQKILAELRTQTRKVKQYNLFALGAAGVLLAGYCAFSYARERTFHGASVKEPISWSQLDKTMEQLDYQRALGLARELVAKSPNYYYGYVYLGQIFLAMGDIDKAEVEYARAYELFPSEENRKPLDAIQRRREKSPQPEARQR